jgi:hypothetical protein
MQFELSAEELTRIIEALDSHVYWQLSDQHYRNDADVVEPGSDDPSQAAEIGACRELADKLQATRA